MAPSRELAPPAFVETPVLRAVDRWHTDNMLDADTPLVGHRHYAEWG
jgi:hypothetical protein